MKHYALSGCLAICLVISGGCGSESPGTDIVSDATDVVADVVADIVTDVVTDVAADVVADITADITTDVTADTTVPPLTKAECLREPTCTRVMVAAHRGFHRPAPENSLAGIRAAAAIGADFAEIDVRDTVDGVLIVMHDSNVNTSTDGTGEVSALTAAEIALLTLDESNPADPETLHVPLFSEVLALAAELDLMLYLDAKTSNWQAILTEIQAGPYYDVVLFRDDFSNAGQIKAADANVMIMPPAANVEDAAAMLAQQPEIYIVEYYPAGSADLPYYEGVKALGLKVQQDVMIGGDLLAQAEGDYTGFKSYVTAGITLMQTDFPELLVPAVKQYNETGVFPDTGPKFEP